MTDAIDGSDDSKTQVPFESDVGSASNKVAVPNVTDLFSRVPNSGVAGFTTNSKVFSAARYVSVWLCFAVIITLPTFLISRLSPLTDAIDGSDDSKTQLPFESDVGSASNKVAVPNVTDLFSRVPTTGRL